MAKDKKDETQTEVAPDPTLALIAERDEFKRQANAATAEAVVLIAQVNRLEENYHNLELANRSSELPFAIYNTAMAKAQALIRTITQDREVEVETLKGGKYSFKYATLSATHDAIREALTSNGFSWMQFPSVNLKDGTVEVRTDINHSSGQSKSGNIILPLLDKTPRGVAGVISYARRYLLNAMTGVASKEEIDLDDDTSQGRFDGMAAPPPPRESPPAQQLPSSTAAPSTASTKPAGKGKKVSQVDLGIALQASANMEEMNLAAREVAAAFDRGDITAAQKDDLGKIFKARRKEIEQGKPDTITKPAEPKAEEKTEGQRVAEEPGSGG